MRIVYECANWYVCDNFVRNCCGGGGHSKSSNYPFRVLLPFRHGVPNVVGARSLLFRDQKISPEIKTDIGYMHDFLH